MFFPKGTQPSRKITEISGGGGGGYDKHPLEWKLYRVGDLSKSAFREQYGYFLELHSIG